jgi:ribosomal-protein-alanine N-acetyltransferase
MNDVVIRRMERADAPVIARLERSIFTDPWSEDMFRDEADRNASSWNRVAVDTAAGAVVGYLVAWLVADEVHLANVAVAQEMRRQGLAQRLLDELEREGRRRHARMVVLEVRRSNEAAQGLYRKNGYATVSIRRRYYRDNHEDALVMIKTLSEPGRIAPGTEA